MSQETRLHLQRRCSGWCFPVIFPAARSCPLNVYPDRLRSRRARAIAWTWALPAEALALRSAHSEAGSVTVANFLHSLGVPDQNHIRQHAKMLKAPSEGAIGNMQMFNEGV